MLDWDDLRYFSAVAKHRTLTSAARELSVNQSTVGRRIASIQSALGVRLLQKTANLYVTTLAGETVRAHVERIEAEVQRLERAVSGQDIRLCGPVRISASSLLTSHLLAPCFATIHLKHPDILIELLPDALKEPVTPQSVDVALQLRPFEQQDVIVRNIGAVAFGLYGCVQYLTRLGEPDDSAGCAGHQLIVLKDDQDLQNQSQWLAEHAARANVVLKADNYETQHRAVCCGGGIGLLPCFRADADQGLQQVRTSSEIPSNVIWLGVHRANRNIPRIRVVLDAVADAIKLRSSTLEPDR